MFYADRLGPRGGNRDGLADTFTYILVIVSKPPPSFGGGEGTKRLKIKHHPAPNVNTNSGKILEKNISDKILEKGL